MYGDWLRRKCLGASIDFYDLHLFYMTASQMDAVMTIRPALPEEYSFVQLDADAHAQQITDKWEHAMKGEVETTK